MSTTTSRWFVDTSVAMRSFLEDSFAAKAWFTAQLRLGATFQGSELLGVEMFRVARRRGARLAKVDEFLVAFHLTSVSAAVIAKAKALVPPLSGADAIHVATALLLDDGTLALATHDAEMANAAIALGLAVHDPVTDDPNRPPVATLRLADGADGGH